MNLALFFIILLAFVAGAHFLAALNQQAWMLPLAAGLVFFIVNISSSYFAARTSHQNQQKPFILKAVPFARRFTYACALFWACFLFVYASYHFPNDASSLSALTRYYGLTAFFLLFIVLTPGLLKVYFPSFPLNGIFSRARRALGVSTFFFALLHSMIAFFYNLSGSLQAVFLLSAGNQAALICSFLAFFILSLLALTSFDKAVAILGRRWKVLHRFVYLAAILAVFHAFLIGSHFMNTNAPLAISVNIFTLSFLMLEAGATARKINANPALKPRVKNIFYQMLAALVLAGCFLSVQTLSFSSHSSHSALVQNDFYLASLSTAPSFFSANQTANLTFSIFDGSGKAVDTFIIAQEKLMHTIVVSSNLEYYSHLHPEYSGNGTFILAAAFPANGTYHLYNGFTLTDNSEHLKKLLLQVGNSSSQGEPALIPGNFSEKISNYSIALSPQTIRANKKVTLSYEIHDEQENPVTDIEPYLGAFGHLAIISEDLQTYVHVHPLNTPSSSDARTGPEVQFDVLFPGAGRYKLFAQFRHKGEVFLTQFVIEVRN